MTLARLDGKRASCNWQVGLILFLVIATLVACSGSTGQSSELTATEASSPTSQRPQPVFLNAEVADTPEKTSQGLMGRTSLEGGMLFVFYKTVTIPFWMKDTLIPLSIAFISEDHKIVDIQDMEPLSEESHYPAESYRYALEVNQGFFEESGIAIGDTLEFQLSGSSNFTTIRFDLEAP